MRIEARKIVGAGILGLLVGFGALLEWRQFGVVAPFAVVAGSAGLLFAFLPMPCVARVAYAVHRMWQEGRGENQFAHADAIRTMKNLARVYRVDGPAALDVAAGGVGDPVLHVAVGRLVDGRDFGPCRRTFERESRRRRRLAADARRVFAIATWLLPLGTAALVGGHWAASGLEVTLSVPLLAFSVTLGALAHLLHRRLLHWLRVRQERDSILLAGCALLEERALPTRIEAILGRRAARLQLPAIA